MVNTKFEAYKLSREIKRSGVKFIFKRQELDKFNEPTGKVITVGSLNGLYHESNSYITEMTNESSVTRTKKQPMLLCLADDYVSVGLKFGDFVEVKSSSTLTQSRTLKFTGAVDVQDWGIITDLSFEVVDDGDDF